MIAAPDVIQPADTHKSDGAGEMLKRVIAIALFCSLLACGGPAIAQSSEITVTITLHIEATASVDAAKVQTATRSAIQGFLSQRADLLASTGPNSARMHSRLSGGTLFGGADTEESAGSSRAGFAQGAGRPSANFQGGLSPASGSRLTEFGNVFDRFTRGGSNRRQDSRVPSEMISSNYGLDPDLAAGGPSGALPFGFSGTAEDGNGRFSFSASLSQLRAAAEQKEREKLALAGGADGLGLIERSSNLAKSQTATTDIWVEGSTAHYSTDRPNSKRRGHASILMVGGDYLVVPGLLVGAMAQFDWMNDNATGDLTLRREGQGWMAGPYMSARLTPNLFFDARAAWGRSDNSIDPLGSYTDSFETSRSLASAKLSGQWEWGAVTLRPSAEIIHFSETQEAYVNAIGIDIASQSYHVGRMMTGPEFGYQIQLTDGAVLEPTIGLKAVWDFSRTDETAAAGQPIGNDDLRGRVEAGLGYRATSGVLIQGAGSYDGLGGSGFQSVDGRLNVSVPLN